MPFLECLYCITKALLYLVEPIVYVKKSSFKKAENPPQKRVHKKRQKQDLLNKGSLFDRLNCSCLPYLRKLLCLFYTFWNTLSKEMRNSNLSRNQKRVHRESKRV